MVRRRILRASHQVDLLDRDTGKPYESGIAMLPILETVRAWSEEAKGLAAGVIENGGARGDSRLLANIERVNDLGRLLNGWVANETRAWLACDKIVGIVGGDHSVPLGAIAAIADKYPGVGSLHIDAHADLRVAYEGFTFSHASIMDNVIRLIVFRNGVEIGRAQVEVRDPDQALGTHVFTVVESQADGTPRWSAVGVTGHAGEDGLPLDPAQVDRIAVPDFFRANVTPLLVPGTTLMVTDAAVQPSTTGVSMTVVTNAAP